VLPQFKLSPFLYCQLAFHFEQGGKVVNHSFLGTQYMIMFGTSFYC